MNRLKREHNERAWLAWHIEALARQKKMPKLSDLTNRKSERRKMTADEIEAATRHWLANAKKRKG